MTMDINSLKTETEYDWALAEIQRYFISPPPVETPEAERFDVLARLIEAYETHHWPIDLQVPPTH